MYTFSLVPSDLNELYLMPYINPVRRGNVLLEVKCAALTTETLNMNCLETLLPKGERGLFVVRYLMKTRIQFLSNSCFLTMRKMSDEFIV